MNALLAPELSLDLACRPEDPRSALCCVRTTLFPRHGAHEVGANYDLPVTLRSFRCAWGTPLPAL